MSNTLSYLKKSNNKRLEAVIDFAKEHLSKITRENGESFFEHGINVTKIINEISNEEILMVVALLHNIFLHPKAKNLIKLSPLTLEEEKLARKMHKLRALNINSKISDLDQFIKTLTEDSRLILLRMAHRLNDIRNLNSFGQIKQKEISRETLHMYTSIAGRLGLHAWRYEMEDICFKILHPQKIKFLESKFSQSKSLDIVSLKQTKNFLATELNKNNIEANITHRIKGLYSTYRKMLLNNRTFEELTDRLALRIIVKNIDDCYRALGVIHSKMHPIPEKLKDYIGAPKENGYQSIHTVVFPLPGVTEQPIEIQIRTQKMHRECEYGFAAHSKYKNISYFIKNNNRVRVNLFRNLEILKVETQSPKQFENVLRTYLRHDHLGIFDHKNNLYHLKNPATVMDFICLAYKYKAAKVKNVRVNGKESDLSRPLKNGDVVEVFFTKKAVLDRRWVTACSQKSSKVLIKSLLESNIK